MLRRKMLQALPWTAILLPVVAGCCTPIGSQQLAATTAAKPAVPNLAPGSYCKVWVAVSPQSNPSASHVYTGTIAGVTDSELVLNNAIDENRVEYGMPVIDDIPFLNMLLKMERRGNSQVETVRLPLAEIMAIEACPPPAAKAETKRETPPQKS
jgi:hypothetical protein